MTNKVEQRLQKILPAITVSDLNDAVRTVGAIFEGGISCMEITFRTPGAADIIKRISKEYPQITLGAGTLLTVEDIQRAKDAGASFGLSPGFNPVTVEAAANIGLPFIPGVMTPADIEQAMTMGCRLLKLFPVAQLGGVAYLQAIAGPYKHTGVQFIPMGGISLSNMLHYLKHSLVRAVGGSWPTDVSSTGEERYREIQLKVKEAVTTAG